jgi:hypothetical protein
LQSACAVFLQKENPDHFLSPPPSPSPPSLRRCYIILCISSLYRVVNFWLSPPSLPPPPRPPAILYSAYQQFDMFLLSSRYNLRFHTFSSRYNLFTPVSAYYCNGLYYSFHSLHKFICIFCNGLYYSFHSLHKFICIFCNGLYYSLHTRQGLTLIPFRHKVRGDPVKLSRYSIDMTIFDNYSLAENADRARPDVFTVHPDLHPRRI